MVDNNVRFIKVALQSTYDALIDKDDRSLYWVVETKRLYCGSTLYGTGDEASSTASGLLSAEDYVKLQELIAAGPSSQDLTPVDGSIVISDGKIGVGISAVEGNLIKVVDDGIFATVDKVEIAQVNGLEDRLTAIEEAAVGGIHYRGSVATKDELPTNPQQGDLYECIDTGIEYCWNGTEWFEYGSAHFVPVAGDGIKVDGSEISVKIAPESHGLVAVDGALSIALATKDSAGAMSAVDKGNLDKLVALDIPTTYGMAYEVSNKPVGTLVNYNGKEVRVMCPADTQWAAQQVGANGDSTKYYIGVRAYAPSSDVVSFKETVGKTMTDQTMYYFEDNEFAGIDANGRKYSIFWLPVAKHNDDDTWTYYGVNSTSDKLIGWDYCVEWYNASGVCVASDLIRINLANEDCARSVEPYYMSGYVTDAELKSAISDVSATMSWTEM